jgi:hypothetical protein
MAQYNAVVRHNMEELLEQFRMALELDLITAEDFAPSTSRRSQAGRTTLRVRST